ncbi:MAG: glycosyltransferase [Methylomonas sp.]|nr:glycosyltransferase [Methylomonas sp.]
MNSAWLRFYPAVTPNQSIIDQWSRSEWPDYQKWIDRNSIGLTEWQKLHVQATSWIKPIKLSLVVPIHNTQAHILSECILSVRLQTYPYWQLILVNDGSSNSETCQLLGSSLCCDPRIEQIHVENTQGISVSSNLGIDRADGDYVVFLDHDDRLALDALQQIANAIRQDTELDILYSDRDMISPQNKRYMHLFKPDWSPETLLSGNYIFHLMCYRRSLLIRLGKFRDEFNGSQDYDLILRASETHPRVKHIDKVLYHWRQHALSVSLNDAAKDYAFIAGVKALEDTLQRRGIQGTVTEISDLWRGMYLIQLPPLSRQKIAVISLDANYPENYVAEINRQMSINEDRPYIAFIDSSIEELNAESLNGLAAWLSLEHVGLISGKVLDRQYNIAYSGMNFTATGSLQIPYQGCPETEAGYMAITRIVRNISAPHPYCVILRR